VNWIYIPFLGILNISALISAYIAYQAVRRRGVPAASALFLLIIAVLEWVLFLALGLTTSDMETRILLGKIAYMGEICAPSLLFVFILEYLEFPGWLTWRNAVLLAVFPVVMLVLMWTNNSHGLIWNTGSPDLVNHSLLVYDWGPFGYVKIVYDDILILFGMGLLIRAYQRGQKEAASRFSLILLSALLPLLAGLLDLAHVKVIPQIPLSPVAYSVSGLFLAYGIFRARFFSLLPIARDLLIEDMRDGVLVLDGKNRVVDINRAGQKIMGVSAESIIGKSAEALPDGWPAAVMLDASQPTVRREMQVEQPIPLYLDLQITPISSRNKKIVGRLIVFRDNTVRKKNELELSRRAEEFLVINRISTIITSGLDLDHVLKILHEQCSLVVPSDVFYVALYEEVTDLIHLPLYFEREYQSHPPRDLHEQPGLTGHIIQTKQTLYIPDVFKQESSIPSLVRMGGDELTRSFIGIPLILRDKVIGVMSVQSYEPNAYSINQVRLLEAVAMQAAIAIENARLYGEVQRLAIVDELTGVYNFRGLMELGRREVERSRRFSRPLTALFFDIDGFRNFNNIYSHATGNLVLEAVADRCRSVLRSVDILARYGGDEFVILLPETDVSTALGIARRLSEEVALTRVKTSHGELSITISLGVARLKENMRTIGSLIDHANRAEHRAKEKGNTVAVDE
jgi:diguanylate cyclase (GGDEF)-like protein/PAS domain S-box-containing protein